MLRDIAEFFHPQISKKYKSTSDLFRIMFQVSLKTLCGIDLNALLFISIDFPWSEHSWHLPQQLSRSYFVWGNTVQWGPGQQSLGDVPGLLWRVLTILKTFW